MSLRITLQHTFPGTGGVLDMTLAAPTPGVTALFGPSGAGKSTLIAAVAGLLRAQRCRVEIDDEVLADSDAGLWLAPERRRIGLVFQDSRLFPHMSIAKNLHFGLRRAVRRTSRAGLIDFDTVVELLGLERLLGRRPHTLSGGERQRVAIGRALLSQPRLLLMDEPLANLDAARKAEILPYLEQLKTTLRLPMLYVTHALDEVAQLADTVVLLNLGRVLAAGSLSDIVTRADLPLAARDDAAAVLAVRVVEHDAERQLTWLETGGDRLVVPLLPVALQQPLRVRIPAREVVLARVEAHNLVDTLSLNNVMRGTVRAINQDNTRHSTMIEVALGEGALLARVTPDSVARLSLVPGMPVLALMKSTAVDVLGLSP